MEQARAAHPEDLARLVQLAEEAVAETAPQRGGRNLIRSVLSEMTAEQAVDVALNDPKSFVAAGTIHEVVFGFGVVVVPTEPDREPAVIRALYVEPPARGIGLGEAIMNSLSDWARAHGAASIDAFALPGNRQAKGFFETHRMTARALIMNRPFHADSEPLRS